MSDLTPERQERVRGYHQRLLQIAEREAMHVATLELKIEALREQGVDTSTYTAPSCQSPDYTLARAQGRAEQAEKELNAYVARFPFLEVGS